MFISHHEIEWGLVGDRVGAVIVSKSSVGDVISPRSRVLSIEDLKVHFDFLVYLFGGEQGNSRMCVGFVLLTGCTSLNILVDVRG